MILKEMRSSCKVRKFFFLSFVLSSPILSFVCFFAVRRQFFVVVVVALAFFDESV